ncbi:MAG: HEAT repeat domain-containing protein [Chthonomonadaceae bacterium]|nr:HEAT repeat domain-containing protein [Chthonomonadaceae bacterium]
MDRTLIFAALALLSTSASAKPHDHNFDLLDVKWKIAFDEPTAGIRGDVVNLIQPPKGLAEIRLDSVGLKIAAAEIDGQKVAWRQEDEELVLTVPPALQSGKRLAVHLVYSGNPEGGVYFVPDARAYPSKTGMIYTQGEPEDTRHWLPTVDHPYDKATTEAFIEVPANRYAVSNGALLDVQERGNTKTFHWRMLQPHSTYLICFTVGDFVEGKEMWNGKPIQYFVPRGLEDQGRQAFEGTADNVRLYSQITGFPYPYPKYAQTVVADYMFGGMENITATTQTIGTLHPASVHPLADSTGLVAHELAHQWFGDTVTCKSWPHIWVNEGFASFLPAFYTRDRDGQDAYDIQRSDTLAGALGASQDMSRSMIKTEYDAPIELFDGFAYGGGAARMFMLMHELTEPVFWDGVRSYLEKYRYQAVTTEDFFRAMSDRTRKDLDGFRKQWFYTPGAPKLVLSRVGDKVTVRQETPGFHVKVPLWALDGNTWVRRNVELDGVASATLEIPARVRTMLIDPDVQLMATIEYDLGYTVDDWAALYEHAPNAGQRARLIAAFPQAMRGALAKRLVDGEAIPSLRSRLIDAVGNDATELLLKYANSEDPFARRSALQAMGRQPRSAALEDVLRTTWESDPNDLLRRAALESLVRLTNDKALVLKALQTVGFQETFRTFALGELVRMDPDAARAVALDWVVHPINETLRVTAINHLGGLKDAAGQRAVFNALADVAREPSFGARSSAIRALQAYGDPAAIPIIEPATHHGLVAMRNTAAGAIAALKGK